MPNVTSEFSLLVQIIGPIPWGHSGLLCHALSLSVVIVVDIDAQAARDSTASDTW